MKYFFLTIAILCLSAKEIIDINTEESRITHLSSTNFTEFIQENQIVFVRFYSRWCVHSKEIEPIFYQVELKMRSEGSQIKFGEIDVTDQKEILSIHKIGYPSFKLFIKGLGEEYLDKAEEDDIIPWLRKKTDPNVQEIIDDFQLNNILSRRLAFLYFFPREDLLAKNNLKSFAIGKEDAEFYIFHDIALLNRIAVTNDAHAIIVIRSFESANKIITRNTTFSEEEIEDYYIQNRYPIVQEFDQIGASRIFKSKEPTMILFDEDSNSPTANNFRKFAEENFGKMIFSISNLKDVLGYKLSNSIGISPIDGRALRIIQFIDGSLKKYKCEIDQMKKCIDDFFEDKLEVYYKSEDTPIQKSNSVFLIVGNNFKDLVLNPLMTVLLLVYAPWCEECQKLFSIFDEIAKKVSSNKDVLVAKINAANNEHPNFEIIHFPSILLYRKGWNNSPLVYKGDYSIDEILKYISKEAGVVVSHEVFSEPEL